MPGLMLVSHSPSVNIAPPEDSLVIVYLPASTQVFPTDSLKVNFKKSSKRYNTRVSRAQHRSMSANDYLVCVAVLERTNPRPIQCVGQFNKRYSLNRLFWIAVSILLKRMQKAYHIPEVPQQSHEFIPLVQPPSEDPGVMAFSRIRCLEGRVVPDILGGDFVEVLQEVKAAAKLWRCRCLVETDS